VGSYPYSGCEQHVLVQSDGKVILFAAQEKFVVLVEEKDAERAVEQASGLVRDEPVRGVLAVVPDDVVLLVL
jgi:hypothetical protein